ncbi:hypothetical protein AAD018_005325 [Aestuariibius insulae]|uniref:hypothetical protein n=1 Tax=Aestuariibius insulae TaxID=2058287 RepID=UPI00345E1070
MINRILLLIIAVGIWTLALKPEGLAAHEDQTCEVYGDGVGEVDSNGKVHVIVIGEAVGSL